MAEYCRINIFEVDEMPIDVYMFYLREAFISQMLKTDSGKEYLENCWRMTQTEPDRKALRKQFGKGAE